MLVLVRVWGLLGLWSLGWLFLNCLKLGVLLLVGGLIVLVSLWGIGSCGLKILVIFRFLGYMYVCWMKNFIFLKKF